MAASTDGGTVKYLSDVAEEVAVNRGEGEGARKSGSGRRGGGV